MQAFTEKVILITGAGSGMGRATALAFAHRGAKVIVAGRRIQACDETAHLIETAGGEAIAISTNVTQSEAVEQLMQKIIKQYGRLDIAFNNAAIEGTITPMVDQTEDDFDAIIAANLKGVWLPMKLQVAQMLKQRGGVIVNNASIGGLVGFPGMSIYVASKHAVLGLTKTVALEYAKQNIRVNAIAPHGIETEMLRRFLTTEAAKSEFAATLPIGRLGKPEEIAEAVVWLCSDAATFITGQTLTVDGGFTAQ